MHKPGKAQQKRGENEGFHEGLILIYTIAVCSLKAIPGTKWVNGNRCGIQDLDMSASGVPVPGANAGSSPRRRQWTPQWYA